jgi:preprotein translocase subunit SecG
MAFLNWLLMILLILLALFLILLVLMQRGKGGGLAGAFGGMGGQSAFGTKAGDLFTWITYGVSAFWLLLCLLGIGLLSRTAHDQLRLSVDPEVQEAPVTPGGAGGASSPGGGVESPSTPPGGSAAGAKPAGDAGQKPNP